MLCTPTISNVGVTRTLIDCGAILNVLSMEAFDQLLVSYDRLSPHQALLWVVDGSAVPLGQIRLPITFDTRDNYHTELIDIDVARIILPCNAILGYPSLTKFMAATHPGYNVLNMPGSSDILIVVGDALLVLKLTYKAAAAA
ncbi:uncharacterized protein [Aegilops tauschii subsp. strangulata]|uniref:uncharacterized protein n=1 Tax=Aegilops tauschii subsp. strangulata TaxID=200361 RepID=UPI00098A3998|nr:uncharacterized protein LOC109774965 [Aegilops tauschii subsp. strangulata]